MPAAAAGCSNGVESWLIRREGAPLVDDDVTSLTDQVRLVRSRMAERFRAHPAVNDPVLLALSEELDHLIILLLRQQNGGAAIGSGGSGSAVASRQPANQAS
jgi:hypothetical protein